MTKRPAMKPKADCDSYSPCTGNYACCVHAPTTHGTAEFAKAQRIKKSPRQLEREIAEALARSSKRGPVSGSSHATKRVAHAEKAKADSKTSDKITIDQLAKMFGLPDWERIDEMNQHNYWEMSRGAEGEDAQMEAETAAQEEIYRQWYDAVESVAGKLLGEHDLELLAMKQTRKVHANYRPHVLKIIPSKSWSDAADKIRETINGVGDNHYNNLREFLDSGPYTARQAVLAHLGYVKRHPAVYGGLGANQMYEQAWR